MRISKADNFGYNFLHMERGLPDITADKTVTFMKDNAVIFALDGTLLDTLDDLTESVNYALKKGGYPELTRDEVRKNAGGSIGDLIRKSVPRGTTWEESWELIAPCNERFTEAQGSAKAYDGISELLDTLKKDGIKAAVVSDKPDDKAKAAVEKYFGDRVSFVYGEAEGVKKRPAPDMLFSAMKEMGVLPTHTTYVGNDALDVQIAKNAGINGVMVSWGYKDRAYLENHAALKIVDTPDELLAEIK